jgi:hypothetical protein
MPEESIMRKHSPSKSALDNRANQRNPIHPAYHRSRGASPEGAQRQAFEAQAQHVKQPEPAANPTPGPSAGGAKR